MSTIRILLVEDDELFRLGLSTRLTRETDIIIAAEAEDGETAIEIINTDIAIDIAILDIGLPGINGLETCQQMRLCRPDLRILVLTSKYQSQSIEDLIAAYVNGYCLKGLASESIVLAIRSIVAGASWWDNAASNEIFSAFRDPERQFLATTETESCEGDPRHRRPAIDKARMALGFDPRMPLPRGLRKTIESFNARSIGKPPARGTRLATA